jgi:hypothetical protein
MISNRQLLLLVLAAVALAAVTGLLTSREATKPSFTPGAPLIPALPAEKIFAITVAKGDAPVVLRRKGDGFVVTNRANYPASSQRVSDLIFKSMEVRAQRKVTEDPVNHPELGVAPESPGAVAVSFYGKPPADAPPEAFGRRLAGYVIGETAQRSVGHMAVYLKRAGEDAVYETESHLRVATNPVDYIEPDLLDIPADDILRMTIKRGDDELVIARDVQGEPVLQDVPEGREAKQYEVKRTLAVLEDFELADVMPAPEADFEWDADFTALLRTGQKYTLRTAEEGGKYYGVLSAEPSGKPVTIDREAQDTDEELEAKEEAVQAEIAARAFTPRHAPWVYELRSWKAKRIRQTMDDLSQEPPVYVSHILISYEGAEGSQATRTKEAARALAEKVLAEATAEGADFVALARKYSDAPTADRGGDLGKLEKGEMDPAFEEAALALAPEEITGPVETPFGFHIIRRQP